MVTQTVSTPNLDPVHTPTAGLTKPEPKPIHDTLRFLGLAFELGLVVVVVLQFQLESSGFRRLTILAAGGFVVHYFLPLRLRIHFSSRFRSSRQRLVGPGRCGVDRPARLVLIGICSLADRVSGFAWACSSRLARCWRFMRESDGIAVADGPRRSGPSSGSMFMFRLIVYMYDLRHEKDRAVRRWLDARVLLHAAERVFPAVSGRSTTRRSGAATTTGRLVGSTRPASTGSLRGVVHLLLYRFVYYYLRIDPTEVRSAGDLRAVTWSPSSCSTCASRDSSTRSSACCTCLASACRRRTTCYYLASSFTDFWRRINIYWKDFMMKIFYYPGCISGCASGGDDRARGRRRSSCSSCTWLLHAYQWFWLRGIVPAGTRRRAVLGDPRGARRRERRSGRTRAATKTGPRHWCLDDRPTR